MYTLCIQNLEYVVCCLPHLQIRIFHFLCFLTALPKLSTNEMFTKFLLLNRIVKTSKNCWCQQINWILTWSCHMSMALAVRSHESLCVQQKIAESSALLSGLLTYMLAWKVFHNNFCWKCSLLIRLILKYIQHQ